MTQPRIRDDFSRKEAFAGLSWLAFGAGLSMCLELLNLNIFTVALALLFNAVLTRTAQRWSPRVMVALVPLCVWVSVFFLLLVLPPLTGNVLVPQNILVILLLFAGIAGGVWPVLRRK